MAKTKKEKFDDAFARAAKSIREKKCAEERRLQKMSPKDKGRALLNLIHNEYFLESKSLNKVEAILTQEVSLEENDIDGFTPIVAAAFWRHSQTLALLIAKGADVNHKTKDDYTALMLAARYGYKDIIRMLTDAGADLNVRNDTGQTARDIAAADKKHATVRLLDDIQAVRDLKITQANQHIESGLPLTRDIKRLKRIKFKNSPADKV